MRESRDVGSGHSQRSPPFVCFFNNHEVRSTLFRLRPFGKAPLAHGPNRSAVQELLLIPGPVAVAPDVLAAAAQPLRNHRGPFAQQLYAHLDECLREIFQTRERVLLLGSSGTGGLEAVVVNLFSPGDTLIAMPFGAFGDRLVAIARAFGARVDVIETQWGERPDPLLLRERLSGDRTGEIKGVLLTHNETSTGVLADLEALANARGDHPALFVVDSVSGLGAADLRMDDWALDAVVTASQKALGGIPGAAMVSLSDRAWRATETARMPRFYFDLRRARDAANKGQTAWTPPFSVLLALERATDNYMKEGRLAAFARHARFAAAIRAGCAAMGLEMFARPGAYSPTVTAVCKPGTIDVRDLQARLRDGHGVVVGGGQQKLEGRIFRIGNMGAVSERDLIGAIGALELSLGGLGWGVSPGLGAGAAERVLAERDSPERLLRGLGDEQNARSTSGQKTIASTQ